MIIHIRDVERELNWGRKMKAIPREGEIVLIDDMRFEVHEVRHTSHPKDAEGFEMDEYPSATLHCKRVG